MARSGDDAESESAARSVLEYVTAIGGLTAAISALLIYFGYESTATLFGYFGVPLGILDFNTTDYLLCSAEVMFRPVLYATCALALLSAIVYLCRRVQSRHPQIAQRKLFYPFALLAALGAIIAIAGLVGGVPGRWAGVALAVSGGCAVVVYDVARRRDTTGLALSILTVGILLILVAAFWLTNIYAYHSGIRKAECITRDECKLADAVVYTKEFMPLPGGQQQPGSARPSWGYVFSGFKVLGYADHRWFLTSFSWDPDARQWKWNGKQHTVILPDNDQEILVRVLPLGASN